MTLFALVHGDFPANPCANVKQELARLVIKPRISVKQRSKIGMKSYFLYLSLSGASLTSSKSKRTNLSRWMTDLPDVVRERSILELAIPGSHDSFAYTLDKTAPFSQNSEGLDDIFEQIGIDKVDEIAKVLYSCLRKTIIN